MVTYPIQPSQLWLIQLLQRGHERSLEEDDLRSVPLRNISRTVHDNLKCTWKEVLSLEQQLKRPLLWATLKSFQVIIIVCAALRVFDTCFLLTLERVFLGQILQQLVSDSEVTDSESESYRLKLPLIGFTLLSLLRLVLGGLYYYALEGVGRKIRIGLTSLVYSKLLRLSQKSLRHVGAGGVINLISNDGAKLENSYEILTVFIGPLQLCSLTWIVWTHFGASSIAGLLAIILLGLCQSYMGKIGTKFRAKVAAASSNRVKLVTQIVTAIRTIKMYAWEVPFAKLVTDARRKELELIRRSHLLRTIGWCLYSCTSTLAMFSTVIIYLSTRNSLTAEKVFVCMTIYQNIGMVLNIDFPKGLAQLGIFLISISRFQEFLLLEECLPSTEVVRRPSLKKKLAKQNGRSNIILRNASVDLCKHPVLSNVTLSVNSADFVAIIGSVGSGKSTFFNTLLKEIPLSSGKVNVLGRIAYAPQQPWLFRGTIRDNILFGKAYNSVKYDNVIQACALPQDLNSFPYGDQTVVAEGGVSLSGGQKARISLARAVYSDADIYLLDDTLSAVDQKVGQHIVTNCFQGLLKHKLRLLITHQLHLLPDSTKVLRIDSGAITPVTFRLNSTSRNAAEVPDCDEDWIEHKTRRISNEKYFDELNGNLTSVPTFLSDQVPLSVYQKYFCGNSKSSRYLAAFVIFTLIAQGFQAGETYFLNFSATGGFSDWNYGSQVAILVSVILVALLTSAQHSSSFLQIIHQNSIKIYDSMFLSVLHAPINFFTDHSAGYVIERFARDTFMLDEVFPFSIFYASHILQKYVTSLLVFLASSFHILLTIPAFLLVYGVYYCQQFQMRSCRSLNRLERGARDSIISHLNSTFHGLTTIRAFRKELKMETQFKSFLDFYFGINFSKLSVICLTSAAIDFLSLLIVNIFILVTMFSSGGGSGSGYGILPLITLTHAIGWAASQFHVIESQAKSVESIFEIMEVQSEGRTEQEENANIDLGPPQDWPRRGKITFDNVNLMYQPGRPVLKNVSFTVYPGEKIGVIGRTGAGKSSLVAALFRLPQPTGQILIDGLNILNMSLRDLRPRISIIPQDPVLFEGTIRTNLDPFGQFSDELLVKCLENVSLVHLVGSGHGCLDMEIQEGGKNLSVGERQLICMARALLRKNKILLLDEATANVDLETSQLIHDKIDEVFAECTVLTIQHRLTSIMKYDRVLVMDDGEVIEFDTPTALLRDPNSYLSQSMSDCHRRLR